MMTNLFSTFDKSVLSFKIYWVSVTLPVFFIFLFSFNLGGVKNLLRHAFGFLAGEMSQLSSGKRMTFSLFFSLFFIILSLNFSSLLSFIYPPTSQGSTVVPMSLMFWGTPFLFSWGTSISGAVKSLTASHTVRSSSFYNLDWNCKSFNSTCYFICSFDCKYDTRTPFAIYFN